MRWFFALAFIVAPLSSGCGRLGDDEQEPAGRGELTVAEAKSFQDFALYYLGDEFERQALNAIDRTLTERYAGGPPGRSNLVSLKYGDCTPGSEGGCPFPLEIQIWPLCERNPANYSLTPDPDGDGPLKPIPLPSEPLTLRRVPAAFYEEGSRLELYVGRVTVVLFGSSRPQLLRAAERLRGLNNPTRSREPLPPPPLGALENGFACP